MRSLASIILTAALAGVAGADCPDCPLFAGGGPAATDCIVEWGGITAASTTCVDGAACDSDGKVDGVCTFPVQACINVGSCTGPLDAPPTVTPSADPVAPALAAKLGALSLSSTACTAAGLAVPVKVGLPGLKPGKARLRVTASAGGKRDVDAVKLTCLPPSSGPSLADVQPIFTAKCTFVGCHSGPAPGAGESLVAGETYASNVNVRSTGSSKMMRVKPGSTKASFMARKILGVGIPAGGGNVMPTGCPAVVPPVTECLTSAETYAILAWIKNGAAQ